MSILQVLNHSNTLVSREGESFGENPLPYQQGVLTVILSRNVRKNSLAQGAADSP